MIIRQNSGFKRGRLRKNSAEIIFEVWWIPTRKLSSNNSHFHLAIKKLLLFTVADLGLCKGRGFDFKGESFSRLTLFSFIFAHFSSFYRSFLSTPPKSTPAFWSTTASKKYCHTIWLVPEDEIARQDDWYVCGVHFKPTNLHLSVIDNMKEFLKAKNRSTCVYRMKIFRDREGNMSIRLTICDTYVYLRMTNMNLNREIQWRLVRDWRGGSTVHNIYFSTKNYRRENFMS